MSKPEEILAQACACLLQNTEGVFVLVDGEAFIVWLDEDTVRIEARDKDERGIGTGELVEHGRKVWMHNEGDFN